MKRPLGTSTGRPPPAKKGRKRDTSKRIYSESSSSSSDSEKPKAKRPDRSARLQGRRGTKTVSVKASFLGRWATHCPGEVKTILDELLEQYVVSISQMAVRGSLVANEAILNYLRLGQVPPVSSTFMRQCMTGDADDPVIQTTIQSDFSDHPAIVRTVGDWVPLNYTANLYTTVFDNNLWMHFESRLKNYIRDWVEVNQIDQGLLKVIEARITGRPNSRITVLPESVWAFINEERLQLGNPEVLYPQSTRSDVLLRYMFRILEYKRVHNRPCGFSIAPIHKVRRHHIVIDTTVLYSMLSEVFNRLGEKSPEWIHEVALLEKTQAIHQYRDLMWTNLVDYSGLSRYEFTHRVVTDGVQATFVFQGPKSQSDEKLDLASILQRVDSQQILRVIAIDPGRTNLITAYDPLCGRFYTFSRRSYYSGISNNLERIRRWERQLQDVNEALSMFSLRSTDLDVCRGYRRVYFEVYNRLWSARIQRKRSKESFRVFSVKQSILDRFFMSFMKGGLPKPIIAYGTAQMRAGGRGELSVPVKRVYNVCKRFYSTFQVNEHLTTQCHSECGSRMHPVKKEQAEKPVRGLKYCPVCHQFVNRDRDACKSIYHAATFETRPFYLRFNRPYQWMEPLELLPQ